MGVLTEQGHKPEDHAELKKFECLEEVCSNACAILLLKKDLSCRLTQLV